MKDPILAQGMTDAYVSAEFLAETVDAALRGEVPFDEALGRYEEFAYELAAIATLPPEMRALLAALAGNPTETSRFLGVVEGTVPFAQFFDPANLRRIIGEPAAA